MGNETFRKEFSLFFMSCFLMTYLHFTHRFCECAFFIPHFYTLIWYVCKMLIFIVFLFVGDAICW